MMVNYNLYRFKKGTTTGLVILSLVLLAGCTTTKKESGAKILEIDNTKATKIVSMGTLTKTQVEKVQDLSKSEVKNDKVTATNGTKVPQKQVASVVQAINTGDETKVKTALQQSPEVEKAITNDQKSETSPSQSMTQLDQAKAYVDKKVDGTTIKDELEKAGTSVDSKEAQGIADQRNLANVIQFNAQKKLPDDVIAISAKRSDGTYVLRDITSGKSYVISVDGSGNITKMVEGGNS